MTDNKTLSKKKESNVIPFDIAGLEADAGLGLQNVTQEDLALPFLKILTAEDAETVGGEARGGDIYNLHLPTPLRGVGTAGYTGRSSEHLYTAGQDRREDAQNRAAWG